MKKLLLIAIALISLSAIAQEKKFDVKFKGFVKTDFFVDTRDVVDAREGHFNLYPKAENLDAAGKDINSIPSTNFLAIQSRIGIILSGPNAFGAKTSGYLEADFFGNANGNFDDVNGFRLRHAFAKLTWKSNQLLMGQYWHPMFVTDCFPGTVSFNTGVPFQPFSRNPQIRFTQSLGKSAKLFISASTQRDFTSKGPESASKPTTPIVSSEFLRNSAIPMFHAQIQINPDSTNHAFGVGVDYKSLLPLTSTTGTGVGGGTYKATARINSLSAIAYSKLDFKKLSIKLEGVFAQNAHDLTMIGGYGQTTAIADPITGEVSYANITTASGWLDIATKGKKVQFGLFGGYAQNLGGEKDIANYFARSNNIDYLYRVSPRIVFPAGKLTLAIEGEYTVAAYGTNNLDGTVANSSEVANFRGLFSCSYKF